MHDVHPAHRPEARSACRPLRVGLAVATLLLALQAHAGLGALSISVRPVVHGAPLELDIPMYTNAVGEIFAVGRVSFLLTEFALERADGGWVELPDTAWMDVASKRLETFFLGGTLTGRYRSVRFHVGPSPAQNAADATKWPAGHALNPNINGLHWSWQGGFIFLALEGMTHLAGGSEFKGWSYHLARDPNRATVVVPVELELARPLSLVLDFDLGTLLNAPRSLSFERDGWATHSREGDPIAAALVANLPGAFRVHRVSPAAEEPTTPAPVQTLYLPARYTPYPFQMPASFPVPELPRDNPLLAERVSLGDRLFRETALSKDGTRSCASCHDRAKAFAEPQRVSVGVEGRSGTRNAMALQNLAWKSSFFWDGRAPSLRTQALMPIQDHAEMGEALTNVVAKLSSNESYRALFAAAFDPPNITPEKIGLALEAFLCTLTSFDARFDRALRGAATLSEAERRGFELFMTEFEPRTGQFGGDCFHCHGGALFTDHQFHNNGLDTDPADLGREKVTGRAADRGKFATPSLRNVALTAPYMHDGRFQTLEEVVNHYRQGLQRSATLDPNLAKHPVDGIPLSDDDAAALVAFLRTLTEER